MNNRVSWQWTSRKHISSTEVEVDAASHLQTSDHSICVLDSEGQVLCWGENGGNHNPLQVMPEGYDMERVRGIDVD